MGSRAAGLDFEDDQPEGALSATRNMHRTHGDAKPGAARFAGEEACNGIAGNRQSETGGDHGIDADDAALRIGQGSTGISGRKTKIGLNPRARPEAAQRTDSVDNAGSESTDEAEGITDGDG